MCLPISVGIGKDASGYSLDVSGSVNVSGALTRQVAILSYSQYGLGTAISIPSGTATTISFPYLFNYQGTAGITASGTNNTTFTNTSGQTLVVIVSYVIKWNSNSTGSRYSTILYNNSQRYGTNDVQACNDYPEFGGTAVIVMSNNDYININCWQNSGSSINIANSGETYVSFAVM